jgi:hypothetical protein
LVIKGKHVEFGLAIIYQQHREQDRFCSQILALMAPPVFCIFYTDKLTKKYNLVRQNRLSSSMITVPE